MKDGFIKIKSASPNIKPADVAFNTESILSQMKKANEEKINILLLPELSLTGFTCLDLLFSDLLLDKAMEGLSQICKLSTNFDLITIIGLPIRYSGKLYNTAAVIQRGTVLGIVPKINIPNYMGFSEKRYFQSGSLLSDDTKISLAKIGEDIPFSSKLIFQSAQISDFSFGIELCEDLWAPIPPSSYLALGGASMIFNLSASPETIGKARQRESYISTLSSRLLCAYIYSNAGTSESSAENIYSGHCIISECGEILAENIPFCSDMGCTAEVDVKKIASLRSINSSFVSDPKNFIYVKFYHENKVTPISKTVYKNPFVKNKTGISAKSFNDIVEMQSHALAKRISSGNYTKAAYITDGTVNDILALHCIVRTFDILKKDHNDISVIFDCFRFKPQETIACLVKYYGCSIGNYGAIRNEALFIHGFNLTDYSTGGMNLRNNDNYLINSSIPKRVVENCAIHVIDSINDPQIKNSLDFMFGKTSDIDDFNDFVLFYTLKYGFGVEKIYRLAKEAYLDIFDEITICDLMKNFYTEFFKNQRVRTSMYDGVQIGSVSLFPKTYFRMYADVSPNIWINEIDKLYKKL